MEKVTHMLTMKRYDTRIMYMLMIHMTDAPLGFVQFEIKRHEVKRLFKMCTVAADTADASRIPGEKTFIIKNFR